MLVAAAAGAQPRRPEAALRPLPVALLCLTAEGLSRRRRRRTTKLLLAGVLKHSSMTAGQVAGHPASSPSAREAPRCQAGSAPAGGELQTRCAPRRPSSTPQGRPGGRTCSSGPAHLGAAGARASRLPACPTAMAAGCLARARARRRAPGSWATAPASWCLAATACASASARAALAWCGVPTTSCWGARSRSSASHSPTATASAPPGRLRRRRASRTRRSWRCTRPAPRPTPSI